MYNKVQQRVRILVSIISKWTFSRGNKHATLELKSSPDPNSPLTEALTMIKVQFTTTLVLLAAVPAERREQQSRIIRSTKFP